MNSAFGGLELFLTYEPNPGTEVVLTTNVLGYPSFSPFDDEKILGIVATRVTSYLDGDTGDTYVKINTELDGEIADSSDFSCNAIDVDAFKLRIFYFNARISVYLNEKWVYTYQLDAVEYPETMEMLLRSDGATIDILNIRKVELFDGRDAVFTDYEATSDSAIQSIIQQRPIDALPGVDREYEFTYDAVKDDVDAIFVREYNAIEQSNSQMSSDGLVYAADVSVSIDPWVAENVGLITRMYRLSELDTGANRAAASLQRRARQSRFRITMSGRLDPRLELKDVQVLDGAVVSSTGRILDERSIVEDITINLQDGIYTQTVIGRRDVDAFE